MAPDSTASATQQLASVEFYKALSPHFQRVSHMGAPFSASPMRRSSSWARRSCAVSLSCDSCAKSARHVLSC
ncbi:unnamed protein product [Chondrus crispus]|uniref:Uncharacterized protein n=1 Tax=Chondrus crispus TaxID=2769 RepID=R7Q5F2_CHOCR|nr:unnamed protein product [Chondrus crispus]CDF33254.1 unnamed protein product [Chondrus crispus]|eukprot:XP_005713057.1 unnamed protein product [Chondrus crispus]